MIRLILYVIMFGAGLYAGSRYERVTSLEQCLNAGGSVDPRGFCIGAD